MKKNESELTAHEQMNRIRRLRQRLAERVAKQKNRPVAWVGGRLYFKDGKMEKVRGIPDLPKPGREAVGWRRQLPKQAKKTIVKAQRTEMVALPAPATRVPEPVPTAEPKPAAGQPLTFTMERKLQALRELAMKGNEQAREALYSEA